MSMDYDVARPEIKEEKVVLDKFLGDVEDGILLERITMIDGIIKKREFFEDGEIVNTERSD